MDYEAAVGTLMFSPGETTQTITVPVEGDALDEDDEMFSVTLTGAVNATTVDDLGVAAIADDDASPGITIASASVIEGDSGLADGALMVSLSAPSGRVVPCRGRQLTARRARVRTT